MRWFRLGSYSCMLALLCCMVGCFPVFLEPLSRTDDFVADPGLGGQWTVDCEDGDRKTCLLEFDTRLDEGTKQQKVISAVISDLPRDSRLQVRLVRLGERYFLQARSLNSWWRGEGRPPLPSVEMLHHAEVYSIWALWLSGDELRLAKLEDLRFREVAEREGLKVHPGGPIDFDSETAVVGWETPVLRAFILKHADEIFQEKTEALVFKRRR